MKNQHRARKRFGQNFLHDEHVIDNIVAAVNPKKSDSIVEIGPGLGALTEPLLRHCEHLDAIELDRDIIPKLAARCANTGRLDIHSIDVLQFDFTRIKTKENGKLRIVGNLPYNITTPLLFHLLAQPVNIQDMHFMVQKEVAQRITAAAGENNYGRLSVMIQHACTSELLIHVGPEAFDPSPKVDSAVIRLTPHASQPWPVEDDKLFAMIVRTAFSQRRKTIRNTLKKVASIEELEEAYIDSGARPETISIKQYAALSNLLSISSAKHL
ncbi:SSU rRNA (adenine(1518)-N(6)/adenine(1519)-N(6))-dimethyltransferase [hydrothermal vent metagenome]|uniref:SSU rRNA (Adenine(1518)-N(6)/adenine(1519)-N(6))-dimethyltransferase n=1 Tax=hydrothermal vent metagenome TaxID=652676 RepID=A0A3B0ZG17_9ZZZZ